MLIGNIRIICGSDIHHPGQSLNPENPGSDIKALKGRIAIAQGEALGRRSIIQLSPEGAYFSFKFQFQIRPFRAYNSAHSLIPGASPLALSIRPFGANPGQSLNPENSGSDILRDAGAWERVSDN